MHIKPLALGEIRWVKINQIFLCNFRRKPLHESLSILVMQADALASLCDSFDPPDQIFNVEAGINLPRTSLFFAANDSTQQNS
ncbi:hypothetical protein LMG919_13295 [Xanthomonas vesicatoria]|nr:hypothetical protein LMG919_13295 [Xanthomonas vesicatoria]